MVELRPLPFNEAIEFFRSKGYQETFDHREMMGEVHAYAFTVAKATQRDILQDIRAAMDEAIANGQTLDQFRQNLKPTLQEKGWWGRKEMLDPNTGEIREVQLGSSRRLKTIFETNMRTSYAAGRWEQVQRTKKTMPYLRYITVDDGKVRPEHRAWHNVVKHVDDPFWDEHYPPNGWGCRCTVQQLGEEDVKRLGLEITEYNPVGLPRNYLNKHTGEIMPVPQGISPGFNYNAGRARMKALTPPPLDEPLTIPYAGPPSSVPMPAPRKAAPDTILPDGMTEPEYAQRFLQEFGATLGEPAIFQDVTGERMVIDEGMFKDQRGRWKLGKRDRARHLLLLAKTIKEPDEIWHVWGEYPKGRMTLRRHYLKRVEIEGSPSPAFVMFDTGKDGWDGVTAFQTDQAYINRMRQGAMVYRRTE